MQKSRMGSVIAAAMSAAAAIAGFSGGAVAQSSGTLSHTWPALPGKSKRKQKHNAAGSKLQSKFGKIGLGMHSSGRAPIGGGTLSPKKDIGKGPALTMPVRGYSTNRQRRKFERAARAEFFANSRKVA